MKIPVGLGEDPIAIRVYHSSQKQQMEVLIGIYVFMGQVSIP